MKIFAFAVAALLANAAPVAAADDFDAYREAIAKLAALPQPARAASPGAAPLFAIVADNKGFFGNRSFSQADIGPLMEMCAAPTQQITRYIMQDVMSTPVPPGADQNKIQETLRAKMTTNVRQYQDELSLLMPFMARCNARLMPLMETYFAALPKEEVNEARLHGARQVQQGAFNNLAGNIIMMSRKEMNEENTLRVARAMAETSTAYVAVLPLAERARLAELAAGELPRLSGEQAAIVTQVIKDLQDKNCGKICMVAAPKGNIFAPYLDASRKLLAMESPPRLASPQGVELLSILGDRERFLNAATIGLENLTELTIACEASTAMMAAYWRHEQEERAKALTKNSKDPAAHWTAMSKVAAQNGVKFQDEIAPLRAFNIQCKARMMPLLEAQLQAMTPEQREARLAALQDFRQQLVSDYANVLTLPAVAGMRPANTRRAVQALAEATQVLAPALQVQNRQALLGLMAARPKKASAEYASEIAQIQRSLENPACEKLCAL